MQRKLVEICQLGHIRLGYAVANGGSGCRFGMVVVGLESHGSQEMMSDVIASPQCRLN